MKTTTILLVFISCFLVSQSHAQIKLGDKLKKETNNRANKNTDQGIDKTFDSVENGVKDLFKKKNPNDTVNSTRQKATAQAGNEAANTQSLKAYSQYDFVPGDKVLLYEDFSQDAVGDFPALWTTNKSGEINTLSVGQGNWFNLNATEGNWWLLKEIEFPKNFIVEFDIVPKKGGPRYAAGVAIYGENGFKEMSDPFSCKTGLIINVAKTGWETQGLKSGSPKIAGDSQLKPVVEETVNHVIIWVQNRRVRIYHQGSKVLDMPTNVYEGSQFTRLAFMLYRGASCSSWISNIKITTASPDTRNKLLEDGKLISYGIYFDVNKDVVKPESYGALNDIAKILNEVPDVKVKIVGHTDSDGQDAANLDLSKRRAAAVKAELAKTFGVNADRLETDGMGEIQPIAPNDTPSNKALNRRVEFLKM